MARKRKKIKTVANPKPKPTSLADHHKLPPKPASGTYLPEQSIKSHGQMNPQSPRMARKNKTAEIERKKKDNTVIHVYGPAESRLRLENSGFHTDVTCLSPSELIKEWSRMAAMLESRPDWGDFMNGNHAFHRGTYTYSAHMVKARAFLSTISTLLTSATENGENAVDGHGTRSGFQDFLETWPMARKMAEDVFADGFQTIQSLSVALPQSWLAMAREMTVFDFVGQKFRCEGGKVFIAVCPEYIIDEVRNNLDPWHAGLDRANPESPWVYNDKCYEQRVQNSILSTHKSTKDATDPVSALKYKALFGPTLANRIQSLPNVDDLKKSGQLTGSPSSLPYQTLNHRGLARLRTLLRAISRRSQILEVLHIQKVPFLDRRVLAVILRACPKLTMIGVYDCPMIQFGDVICLLDLIHEINKERAKSNQALIRAFDFYPHYNAGTPFAHSNAGAYGITWNPESIDVIQRGFYRIILEAFLKARQMQIDLLFSKDKAFREYLFRVPGPPLSVSSFLDGLHRYLDLAKKRSTNNNARKQALYDTLKPVRLGIERITDDWPSWYCGSMGANLFFCASCGHDMVEEFFTRRAREMIPHTRVCAGCTLRRWLDDEADHQRQQKKQLLGRLFPDWNGFRFNDDAPLDAKGRGLLTLRTKDHVRPPTPLARMMADGTMYQPQHLHELVRDNKVHEDSLQGLPPLSELVDNDLSTSKWSIAMWEAMTLDVNQVVSQKLRQHRANGKGDKPSQAEYTNGGISYHFDELQRERSEDKGHCHSFHSAAALQRRMNKRQY